MLTPNYLITNQSEKCPAADHALLLEHDQAPYYPLLGGTHSFEGTNPLWPPLPGKAIKLFFSTSPKSLSLRFNSVSGYRGQISATLPVKGRAGSHNEEATCVRRPREAQVKPAGVAGEHWSPGRLPTWAVCPLCLPAPRSWGPVEVCSPTRALPTGRSLCDRDISLYTFYY